MYTVAADHYTVILTLQIPESNVVAVQTGLSNMLKVGRCGDSGTACLDDRAALNVQYRSNGLRVTLLRLHFKCNLMLDVPPHVLESVDRVVDELQNLQINQIIDRRPVLASTPLIDNMF